MKRIIVLSLTLTSILGLSGCVFGDGVVKAVEDYYVTSKKEVLVVSGTVASSRLCLSPFTIDEPPTRDKVYKNPNNQTLEFKNDGTVNYVKLNCRGGEKILEFLNYGGPKKDTVIGFHY